MDWLRLYTEITRDRKLRRHSPTVRWTWITILCIARTSPLPGVLLLSENVPVTLEDIADEAAISIKDARYAVALFVEQNMLNEENGIYNVTHFQERQYVSDSSTERVRNYRERKKKQECNVSVTPPDTDTDTDTDNNTSSDEDTCTENKRNKLPRIDYQDITDKFNFICGDCFPKVIKVTDGRKRIIKALLSKDYTLDDVFKVFQKARDSDFVSGRNGRWSGCNFDWLIIQRNFQKVLEGSYDNERYQQQQQQPVDKSSPVNYDQVWNKVKSLLNPYKVPDWDDSFIEKAVRQANYANLCNMNEYDAKRVFISAYKNALKEVG